MLYKDIFILSANGTSSTAQFEESINVVEVAMTGTSTLTTVKFYHSVGNRIFSQIGTATVNATFPRADIHVGSWPPGYYYIVVTGMLGGDNVYVSFSGE